jgi:hypothetical protein
MKKSRPGLKPRLQAKACSTLLNPTPRNARYVFAALVNSSEIL